MSEFFKGDEGVYFDPTSDEIFLLEKKEIRTTVNRNTGKVTDHALYRLSCSKFKNDRLAVKAGVGFTRIGDL